MKAMKAIKWEVTNVQKTINMKYHKREIKVIYLYAHVIVIGINLTIRIYMLCVLTCCGSRGPYTGSPEDRSSRRWT